MWWKVGGGALIAVFVIASWSGLIDLAYVILMWLGMIAFGLLVLFEKVINLFDFKGRREQREWKAVFQAHQARLAESANHEPALLSFDGTEFTFDNGLTVCDSTIRDENGDIVRGTMYPNGTVYKDDGDIITSNGEMIPFPERDPNSRMAKRLRKLRETGR